MPVVTLTTDFGMADGYVAAMKGVILGIAPQTQLVDLTHAVPPHDVRHAAYVLYTACRYFARGTVHLAVVDPGVGSQRRAIAVQTPTGHFVGPDNGLFSYIVQMAQTVTVVQLAAGVQPAHEVSQTFHGRDVFAPAAARLASGVPITDLGHRIVDPVLFSPRLSVESGVLEGEVLHVDRFGNLVTSISSLRWLRDLIGLTPAPWATTSRGFGGRGEPGDARPEPRELWLDPRHATVTAAGQRLIGVHHTYAEVAPGEVLALIGSNGHLEIAVRDGSAATQTALRREDTISLRYESAGCSAARLRGRPAD